MEFLLLLRVMENIVQTVKFRLKFTSWLLPVAVILWH